MKKSLQLIGEYYLLMRQVFQKPDKGRIFWRQYAVESQKLILDSIPIIGIISLFIGAVIVIQTANNMGNPFIPKMYVGYMARECIERPTSIIRGSEEDKRRAAGELGEDSLACGSAVEL